MATNTKGSNTYMLYGEIRGAELIGDSLILLTFYKHSKPDISVRELNRLPKGVLAVYFKKLEGVETWGREGGDKS